MQRERITIKANADAPKGVLEGKILGNQLRSEKRFEIFLASHCGYLGTKSSKEKL